MKTKLILSLLLLGSSVSANAQVFGRNADAGAVVGGIVGAVIGHNNGQKVWQGAAIGAGVGLVAGAIADNNEYRGYDNRQVVYEQPSYQDTYSYHDDYDFYPSYGQVVVSRPPTRVVVVQAPPPPPRVVVVHRHTPVYREVYAYPTHGYVQHVPVRNAPPCVVQNNQPRQPNYNNNRPPVNAGRRDGERRDNDRRR